MKKKSWLLVSVISLFITLSMTITIWIAHTRVITNAIISLGDNMRGYSIVLQYGDITFSKQSVLDIKAEIKDVAIVAGEGGLAHTYRVNGIKINSNLWTRSLSLELDGDVKTTGKVGEGSINGVYKFTHNPIIKIDVRNPLTRSWNSTDMIQQVRLEDVGYQYMNEDDGKLRSLTTLESMNGVLDNRGERGELDWDLQFNFINHEYVKGVVVADEMDQRVRDLYKIVALEGKSSMQIATNISEKDGMKIAKDINDKLIDLKIKNITFSSQLYTVQVRGEVEKKMTSSIPYFDVEISVTDLEHMLLHYADALNINIENLRKHAPYSKFGFIKKDDVLAIARVLREAFHSPNEGGVSIKMVRNMQDFQIANLSLPVLIKRIQDVLSVDKDDSKAIKKSNSGKKRKQSKK